MTFENPDALWLLLALPPLLLGLGFWGWKAKKEAAAIFPLSLRHLGKKQLEKYATAGILMVMLIITLALPRVTYYVSAAAEKTGEIALLVDVSRSMAARKDPDSTSRLERVKPVLYEIIDSMEMLGQVKISLHGFTTIARSHVPFVGKEDYPYLKESIKKMLDINSIPGDGTSLGESVQNVVGKFSEAEQAKIIILFSDGEPYFLLRQGLTYHEESNIKRAVKEATENGVKVITVGFGEQEGARIPLYDSDGEFTGNYAKRLGVDYVSYFEEEFLKNIAEQTDGEYFYEEKLEGLIEYIIDNLGPVNSSNSSKEVKVYQPVAHWFLLASLPIWVVFTRRHILG
ncbi:MAG TPA: VWA domain-containing protein [Dehalococcoidia bacterium]|nr:VWA domain-containing protein [Dehalococcoidia bacterium]